MTTGTSSLVSSRNILTALQRRHRRKEAIICVNKITLLCLGHHWGGKPLLVLRGMAITSDFKTALKQDHSPWIGACGVLGLRNCPIAKCRHDFTSSTIDDCFLDIR